MRAEQYPTLGSVFPLIHGILENHLKDVKPDDPEEIQFSKKTVNAAMKKIFKLGRCDESEGEEKERGKG